MKSINLSVSDL